jgi:hypothetical protein
VGNHSSKRNSHAQYHFKLVCRDDHEVVRAAVDEASHFTWVGTERHDCATVSVRSKGLAKHKALLESARRADDDNVEVCGVEGHGSGRLRLHHNPKTRFL